MSEDLEELRGALEETGLSKKEIEKVFDALGTMISEGIRRTDDVFVLPGDRHVILLDFVMPRMNGYQFCREAWSISAS